MIRWALSGDLVTTADAHTALGRRWGQLRRCCWQFCDIHPRKIILRVSPVSCLVAGCMWQTVADSGVVNCNCDTRAREIMTIASFERLAGCNNATYLFLLAQYFLDPLLRPCFAGQEHVSAVLACTICWLLICWYAVLWVMCLLVLCWRWLVNCSHLSDLWLHHRLWQRRCRAVLGLCCIWPSYPHRHHVTALSSPIVPLQPGQVTLGRGYTGDAPLAPVTALLGVIIFFSVPCTFHTWYMVKCHSLCVE